MLHLAALRHAARGAGGAAPRVAAGRAAAARLSRGVQLGQAAPRRKGAHQGAMRASSVSTGSTGLVLMRHRNPRAAGAERQRALPAAGRARQAAEGVHHGRAEALPAAAGRAERRALRGRRQDVLAAHRGRRTHSRKHVAGMSAVVHSAQAPRAAACRVPRRTCFATARASRAASRRRICRAAACRARRTRWRSRAPPSCASGTPPSRRVRLARVQRLAAACELHTHASASLNRHHFPQICRQFDGIGKVHAAALAAGGYTTLDEVDAADPRRLEAVTGRMYP